MSETKSDRAGSFVWPGLRSAYCCVGYASLQTWCVEGRQACAREVDELAGNHYLFGDAAIPRQYCHMGSQWIQTRDLLTEECKSDILLARIV